MPEPEYDSEFARLRRKARRALPFGAPQDINLPDENPRRKGQAAIEALQRASRVAQKLDAAKKK